MRPAVRAPLLCPRRVRGAAGVALGAVAEPCAGAGTVLHQGPTATRHVKGSDRAASYLCRGLLGAGWTARGGVILRHLCRGRHTFLPQMQGFLRMGWGLSARFWRDLVALRRVTSSLFWESDWRLDAFLRRVASVEGARKGAGLQRSAQPRTFDGRDRRFVGGFRAGGRMLCLEPTMGPANTRRIMLN